jgi:hypothetical protein
VTEHYDRVAAILSDAAQLRDGPPKVAAYQDAAAIADSHQDLALAFSIRKTLLGVCLGADQSELMLVTFAWCLAQHDRDPQRFPIYQILWEFRWVVSSLPTFPEITRAKINEMKAEMVSRYQSAGASPRSYWLMCRKMAVDMGDAEAAIEADLCLQRSPIDWLADGPETETGFEITYRLFRKQYAKSLAAAEQFLTRNLRSDHFEGQACADALLPLLRLGRAAEAMPYHRRGYKLRGDIVRHLDSIAKHIEFLALTDNLSRATRLFEKHLPDALRTTNLFNRLRFLNDTLPLLDRLIRAGKKGVTIRVPDECPIAEEGLVMVCELRGWVHSTASDLAQRFDERNGNDYFAGRLAAAPRLQRLFSPCPLTR